MRIIFSLIFDKKNICKDILHILFHEVFNKTCIILQKSILTNSKCFIKYILFYEKYFTKNFIKTVCKNII